MNQDELNILTLGTDETIFDQDSALRQRVLDYGTNFTSFHVFCKSRIKRPTEILGPVVIHPLPKFWPFFLFAGYSVGSSLLQHGGRWVISSENFSGEGMLAFLLSRRFSIPLQLQIHTDVFSPWYRRAGWKERIRYWLAKFLIPRADCIRVVSERIRASIATRNKKQEARIIILPIWTDITKFFEAKPDPATERRLENFEFKMIAVGRFVDKEKNFSMLIEMMRDFVKICPKALLVIVGDGPDRTNYESKTKNQGLENCVILERWRDDLPSFYKSFDLFLLSSNYEGWGRTVIEAMASGLPVVMTDVGLAGEVIRNGENGVVVPVGEREAMLHAVTKLFNNPQERKRLAEAGLAKVKKLEPITKKEYLKKYAASYCNSKSR